jgi:hypothetical protein
VLVQLHRTDELQLQLVDQPEVVVRIVALVEHQCGFRQDRLRPGQFPEKRREATQHARKLFGVVALAFVDVVEQRQTAVGRAKQSVTDLPQVVAALLILATLGQFATQVESIDKRVEIGAVIANRTEVDLFPLDGVAEQSLPDASGSPVVDAVHVIPEALRTEGLLGGFGEVPPEGGLRKPFGDGTFAFGADGAVDGGDGEILAEGEGLFSLGADLVHERNELSTPSLLPEGFGQSPLKDFGVERRGAGLDGLHDIFELAEIFLPDAAAASVFTRPAGIVIVRISVNLLCFEPFHARISVPSVNSAWQAYRERQGDVFGQEQSILGDTRSRKNSNFRLIFEENRHKFQGTQKNDRNLMCVNGLRIIAIPKSESRARCCGGKNALSHAR